MQMAETQTCKSILPPSLPVVILLLLFCDAYIATGSPDPLCMHGALLSVT